MAALTGQEINHSELGREVGIHPKTVNRWMAVMQACYQWQEIWPYQGNLIKRMSKKRKGYFFDTGMICYLQRLSSPDALAHSPQLGALFETFVINQIKILSHLLSPAPQLYHWRISSGAEVDLVLERDNTYYPIEIKCKTHLNQHDTRGIRAFKESYPHLMLARGLIIYAGEEIYSLNPDVLAVPWSIFNYEL